MALTHRPTHTVEVTDPSEYRDAIEAADTLGLELHEVEVRGAWESRNGAGPTRGSTWSIYKKTEDAQKWFYIGGNGYGMFAARPVSSRADCIDDGALELKFD
jgi:hypothetical protein